MASHKSDAQSAMVGVAVACSVAVALIPNLPETGSIQLDQADVVVASSRSLHLHVVCINVMPSLGISYGILQQIRPYLMDHSSMV